MTWTDTIRVTRLLAALLALALLAAACGGDGGDDASAGGDEAVDAEGGGVGEGDPTPSEVADAPLSETYDLSGATFRVGSKDFTETLILGQLARGALEAAGAEVELTENLPSPAGTRDALVADEIDMAWEYTSTAWINYLGNETVEDGTGPIELYEQVAEADLEQNDIVWSPPASFDNTYGIAVRGDAEGELGELETISDLVAFVEENPDEATLCVDNNFVGRDDGLPALEETYGFTWPDDNLFISDFGVIYTNTAEGEPCNFGEIFTTDGRLSALDLKVLEDDQGAFLSYLSSMMIPQALAEEYPDLEQLFADIGEPITEEVMTDMNAAVDVDGEFPEDVADQYLSEYGFTE